MEENSNMVHSLCIKCQDNIPKLLLNDDIISINCQCGYKGEIPIQDYINKYNDNSKQMCKYNRKCSCSNGGIYEYYCDICLKMGCEKCESHICNGFENYESKYIQSTKMTNKINISEIRENMNQAQEFLNTYFPLLKEEYLQKEKSQEKITKFNDVYEKSLNKNKNILIFIGIVLENYHTDNYILYENLLYNKQINIYKYIEDKNIDSITEYFNHYSINIYKKYAEYKIYEKDKITFLCILKDGRLATTNNNGDVTVFRIQPEFKIDFNLKIHESNNSVFSVSQLDNGKFVSLTGSSIKVWSVNNNTVEYFLTIENEWEERTPIISLTKNRIACGISGVGIYIWDFNETYNKEPSTILVGKEKWDNHILYIKDREILYTHGGYGSIYVWDLVNYKCVAQYNNDLVTGHYGFTYLMDDDTKLALFCNSKFGILNTKTGEIEKKVQYEEDIYPFSCIKLRDNKTLLMAGNLFYQFDLTNDKLTKIYPSNLCDSIGVKIPLHQFTDIIYNLLIIDDHSFISYNKQSVQLWKY